jgi:predicted pyridoxine 5'-phosphate oxidase superfamily flavin-nucleotide-binding protein
MKIPESIQKIFKEDSAVAFGTATLDGNPNINMIGIKKIQDDETIILADNYFNKTLANVRKNNKGTILTKRAEEKLWYQLKGTYKYINEGPEYEALKQWAKSIKETYPAKGMVIFKVEKIYNSIPGPNAGNLIEEK